MRVKEFRFGDLISDRDIYIAKAINKDDLTVSNGDTNAIRYITRTGENNGCELLADRREVSINYIESGNAITIGDTTATCFYQDEDFITGDHMVVVRADSWLNRDRALYVIALLNNEQYKYSYGRAFLMERIKDTVLKLPVKGDGNPDWQFMEEYIKSLHHKPLTTKNKPGQAPELNVQDWGEFDLADLFGDCERGTRITTDDRTDGNIPFCTAGEFNEGISELIGNPEAKIYKNALSIDMFGNCFYHGYDFKCDDNILVITNEHINEYTGLFLSQVISADKYRNNYGRQYRQKDYVKHKIKLPIDADGNPDWQFMEDYIKALPYGDRLEG